MQNEIIKTNYLTDILDELVKFPSIIRNSYYVETNLWCSLINRRLRLISRYLCLKKNFALKRCSTKSLVAFFFHSALLLIFVQSFYLFDRKQPKLWYFKLKWLDFDLLPREITSTKILLVFYHLDQN